MVIAHDEKEKAVQFFKGLAISLVLGLIMWCFILWGFF